MPKPGAQMHARGRLHRLLPMQEASTTTQLRMGAGVSGHLDAAMAAEYAAGRCAESLGEAAGSGVSADLAVVFISAHHAAQASEVAAIVRRKLDAKTLIGCTAEAVVGGEMELENAPGVSVLAARLPGVRVRAFTTEELPIEREQASIEPTQLAEIAGITPEHRATILLADPFSVPVNTLLPMLARARRDLMGPIDEASDEPSFRRVAPILGGMASAGSKPGQNTLLIDDRVLHSGGVGLSLSGRVRVDAMVSQGCRAIGPTMVITGVKGQLLMTLGGRPALEVLEEVLDALSPKFRERLGKGLFIGRAVSAHKDRFGRDDFLIRNVVGVEKTSKSVAVADLLRVGQTVQFHVRDAQTASKDLGLLLDAQRLYEPPAGVLLFTCNGRGTRLFQQPHHDAGAICRAFAPTPGEIAAKLGQAIPAPAHPIPLAGFFCAGEIGPVGNEVFVHGQAACAAIFRGM